MSAIKPIFLCLLLGLDVIFAQGQAKPIAKNVVDSPVIKIDTLKIAIVTAVTRPHMKGDTLEYNVEHMAMPPNAVVEELLRRLPGLRVDPDGTITYNGEKIQHLLVDGQDIFGSEPTLVTRSFDASKIARIQILDRKSEQALFTGIDDGSRTKTLNLVLKESAKNGYFGKVEAGGNLAGLYNGNAALAGFRDKVQFTAIGMASNTGVLGVSNSGGGQIDFLYGISDPLSASAGTGIPKYAATAVHYANSWGGQIDHVEGNYQYSHYYSQPITNSQSLQTQPDSIFGQYQSSRSLNLQQQNWVDAKYDWAPSDRTAFAFKFRGYDTQQQNQYISAGNSTFNDTLVNSSQRTIQDHMSRQNMISGADWRIQIGRRADRIFSIMTTVSKIDATTNGYLYSLNQFYQPNGQVQSKDTVDQRKQIVSHSLNLNSSLNYVEPLWKGAVIGVSYGFSFSGVQPFQGTYNRGGGKYQEIVDSLSSHLKTQEINQHVIVNLQGKTGHLGYTMGNDWLLFDYRQQDLIVDSVLRQHYANWAPRVLINFTANQNTNLYFNYNSNTQQPSIAQLAPIKNNNNPLYITLGNPDLKPSLNQDFELGLHRFKTWEINLGLDLKVSSNNISAKTVTDSLGRQISQPVNVDGIHSVGVNFSLNGRILGFEMGLHANGMYSRSVNYINTYLNRNDAYTVGGGFSLSRYVPEKYNLLLNTNFVYFDQISSINTAAPVQYWTQNQQGALTLYLLKGFEINTTAIYSWQQKTSAFSNSTSVLLCNSSLSRNFMHNRLAIKAQFNNMFNQNSGISRSNSGNINSQSSTNILGRYWMLNAIYHFDKKFKQK